MDISEDLFDCFFTITTRNIVRGGGVEAGLDREALFTLGINNDYLCKAAFKCS